jgi:hypothetical protein
LTPETLPIFICCRRSWITASIIPHQPKEDAIYAVMVSRKLRLEPGIADLTVVHEKLGGQTRYVHNTVERLMRDETMSWGLAIIE